MKSKKNKRSNQSKQTKIEFKNKGTNVEEPVEEELKKNEKCVVIGNGRSLKGFDFTSINRKEYDTIGCCFAFRHWDKIDWYPDVYVNVDHVVLKENIDEIKEFILKKKCRAYILSVAIKEVWEDIPENDICVVYVEQLMNVKMSLLSLVREWCSGSVATLVGLDGFQEVKMIGFDCDYVEMIPECEKCPDGSLRITKTPDVNPNYFIDDYQRKGDKYNIPNGKKIHYKSWEQLSYIVKFINSMYPEDKRTLTNYNDKDSVKAFIQTLPLKDF